MKPALLVLGWLDALPGSRVIITSSELVLDASELTGFEPDARRVVRSELPLVPGELEDMLGELRELEARGWEYPEGPEGELLNAALSSERVAKPGSDEDDGTKQS